MRWPALVPAALSLVALALAGASCGARTEIGRLGGGSGEPRDLYCGDGVIDAGEACDDANDTDGDACARCAVATCGDGFVRKGFEACDPADLSGPTCTARCALPTCGDGLIDPGEACDGGDGCTVTCMLATCGDGIVQQDEECDAGAANDDGPAAYVVQDGVIEGIAPFDPGVGQIDFYDYRSASSHTGLEVVDQSNLFLFVDPGAPGEVSLFTIHGIDRDGGGPALGRAHVVQSFAGLPAGAFIELADDRPREFDFVAPGQVSGDWSFHDNTDGGIIGGLPWPGDYVIAIDTTLEGNVTSWGALDPTRDRRALQVGEQALLVVQTRRSACRTDCTVPRCNDGIVDAGEVCDDGNPDAGDACAPDCQGP